MANVLLCLRLRLRLLLFLELQFLVGGRPPLHSSPPPPFVFVCYDAVYQQHKQRDDQKCRKSSSGIWAVLIRQLQADATLYDGKSH